MPSYRVNYDADALTENVENLLEKKLEKGLSNEVKWYAANKYKDIIEQYVPLGGSYKGHTGGALRREARVVPEGDDYAIRYSATSPKGKDYAEAQYEGPEWWERTTPGTYSHWNRHMSRSDRLEWYQYVADSIMEAMNG